MKLCVECGFEYGGVLCPHWRDNVDFREWSEEYGLESARKQFGLSDHLVFIVHPSHVVAQCGDWRGSEPRNRQGGNSIDTAKEKLRQAIQHAHSTEETIHVF